MRYLLFFIGLIIGIIIGLMIGIRIAILVAKNKRLNEKKFYNYYKYITRMFEQHLEDVDLFPQIKESERIAIYGCAEMGIITKKILELKGKKVAYFIDRKLAGEKINELEVRATDTIIDDVDWVIVTPYIYYEEIAEKLSYDKRKTTVVALDKFID